MPRPDMLTDERHKRGVKAFSDGASVPMACDYMGVSETTFYNWLNRGREDLENGEDTKYVLFLGEIKAARYEYEMSLCKEIEAQGRDGRWQAHAWLLERRNPRSFSANGEQIRRLEAIEKKLGLDNEDLC